MNIVYAPDRAIGKNNPFNSLVCGIVNRLPDVNVFKLNADGFDLDEKSDVLINLHSQINERSVDRVLARDLMIFVITANVREDVVYDGDGVGFTEVFLLDCSQNALVAFHLRCNSVSLARNRAGLATFSIDETNDRSTWGACRARRPSWARRSLRCDLLLFAGSQSQR